jgi:hypothetical protein
MMIEPLPQVAMRRCLPDRYRHIYGHLPATPSARRDTFHKTNPLRLMIKMAVSVPRWHHLSSTDGRYARTLLFW